MSAGLIKHLKAKTEADANTEILMAQWSFDERIVGKSLENVGSYYPHFSSHNESHSQQILVNIERLLGSNIHQLTATDTWLILEAAYWHDIGMLFSAEEVQGLIEDEKFKDYVESLACDNTQDLHEFAKVWHHEGWQKALTEQSTPHLGVEKYRQMVAEWYRRGHAKNSSSVVMDPFKKLAINSPRTELLPQRIYRYLGQICYAHGRSFEEVMNELPFRQTGMGTEDCHPRFVACLLRLGDLFDIDDNRFCPVMAKQVSNMPALSATHEQKHKAIREFQLDNETVSVTAICSTEMAYIECRNWFDWIKEEIQNQMSQWKNIVPNREFGLLPTIDKLHVEMDDKKILLNDKPMKFSLDEKNVIELLQGNNLYHGIKDVLREILQNSIDATLIRVWIDSKEDDIKRNILECGNPYSIEVQKIFKEYSIKVWLHLIEKTENYENIWKLCIEDQGTGISLDDLKHMQYMGGSDKNLKKKKLIEEMPLWMRPSGTFGIGMHSAFILHKNLPEEYHKLTFKTKSIISHNSLEIKMNSPLSKDNGYCFITCIDSFKKYGTLTELFFLTDVVFPNINSEIYPESNRVLSQLSDSLTDTFVRSILKIDFQSLILEPNNEKEPYYSDQNFKPLNSIAWFEYKEYGFAIQIHVPDTICSKDFYYGNTYVFRGQEIPTDKYTDLIFDIPFGMGIYIDIYGKSKDFVSISRNDWQSSYIIESVMDKVRSIVNEKSKVGIMINDLIYGFEYNKYLGLNIIKSLFKSQSISNFDIANFKLDDNTSMMEILNRKAFIVGKNIYSNKIIKYFEEILKINNIELFDSFNDIYNNATIEYLIENNFNVLDVSIVTRFKDMDNQHLPRSLFFYNKEIYEEIFIPPVFELDDTTFIIIKNFNIDNSEEVYRNKNLKFFEKITDFERESVDSSLIVINNFYIDYYLFEDFKDLKVDVVTDLSFHYLDYKETGIIFPFYFESEDILLHDLEKLYEFVKAKLVDSNLSINDIRKMYKELILLTEKLTRNSPQWVSFFNSYKL